MGNRAIITVQGMEDVGIYLHWNGGPESVLAFLGAAKQLGVRSPEDDDTYFMGRFAQIIGNYFGGTTSIGIGPSKQMDDGDNGVYTVGGDFNIVGRQVSGPTTVDELCGDDRKRYEAILADCVRKNEAVFKER